jgi:hypothetical protein
MFCCATVSVASSGSAFFDHDMTLPTPTLRPDRLFRGQRFCRSLATDAIWRPWRVPGFVARGTGIGDATGGVASVYVARPDGPIAPIGTTHRSDVLFTFVLAGTVTLEAARPGAHSLEEGDAYVVSPDLETALGDVSSNLDLLEVALPAVAPAASPAS